MPNKSVTVILTVFLFFFASPLFAADESAAPKSKPGYVSLGDKPLVLNLATDSKRLTFLQVKAEVLVKNDDAKEIVKANIPAIRHKLILILSEQNAKDMKTPAKREEVRKQATTEIREMINEMTNNNDIDEILFSTFLIQ